MIGDQIVRKEDQEKMQMHYESIHNNYPEYMTEGWGLNRGIETPPGWNALLDEFLAKLKASESKLSLVQIKQKFGRLCIYTSNTSEADHELIGEAIRLACKTCVVCGGAADSRSKVNHNVYCEDHAVQ